MAKSPKTGKDIPVYSKGKAPREKLTLDKKASNDVGISRMVLGAQGIDGLRSVHGRIRENILHPELLWPLSIVTYSAMSLDPTVAAVHNFYDMLISRADFKFVAPNEKDSDGNDTGQPKKEVQDATDFLNFCMLNMESQTWQQFIVGIGTYRIFGFSIAEKIWTTVKRGKYKGRLKWKCLAQRAQETILEWRWDKNDPDQLTGVIQRAMVMDASRYKTSEFRGERKIDRSKFILFRFDPKKNNPQGTSPLDGAWKAWKYLNLVQEYQSVGIAKDLGGIPVIGIPVDKLIEAAADPNGTAAMTIDSLKSQASALHAGDRTFVIKPILYDDQGNELYTFELQGIQGGGKQYDLSDVIRSYQNEILTVYSASLLKMGQDSTGSFALSDNFNNLLGFAVEHNLAIIRDQINDDLIPQTLAANGWLFEQEDMPTLEYGDVAPRDLDELGKFVQRVVTAGAMSIGKGLDKELRKVSGLPEPTFDTDDEMPEEFMTGKQSAAGQGDGTSGTGTSQTNGDNNRENK